MNSFCKRLQFLAGAVLALCAYKVHLFILAPLWIIAARRWRVAYGMLAAGAGLTAVSTIVAGPGWIAANYEAASRYDAAVDATAKMPNLLGLFRALPHRYVWVACGFVCIAVLTFAAARKARTEFGLALAIAGGLVASTHAFLYDCSLLLPLILTLANVCGLGSAIGLSAVFSLLSITLTMPPLSYIGQVSIVALLCYACYLALSGALQPAVSGTAAPQP